MALTTAITTSVLVRAFLVGKMVCSRAKASYAGTGSITSTHGLEPTVAGASAGMKTPLETKPPTMQLCVQWNRHGLKFLRMHPFCRRLHLLLPGYYRCQPQHARRNLCALNHLRLISFSSTYENRYHCIF